MQQEHPANDGYNNQLSGPEREAFFSLLHWLNGD